MQKPHFYTTHGDESIVPSRCPMKIALPSCDQLGERLRKYTSDRIRLMEGRRFMQLWAKIGSRKVQSSGTAAHPDHASSACGEALTHLLSPQCIYMHFLQGRSATFITLEFLWVLIASLEGYKRALTERKGRRERRQAETWA